MRRFTSSSGRYPRKAGSDLYVGPVGNWSNPTTWGGTIPPNGNSPTIGPGVTVVLDCATASLGTLLINGTLIIDNTKDVAITAATISIGANGKLQIGTEAQPYAKNAVITLTGTENARAQRYVPDVTATSGAGNGRLARLNASTGAVAETITVTFSSATDFTVNGSVSGALGSGTVGTLFNNKVRFIATAGTTPWANTHTNTITVVALGFTNDGVGRSLQVASGGKLILIGTPPSVIRTRLDANHANVNDTTLTLASAGFAGRRDRIVVGPTDFSDTTEGTPDVYFATSTNTTATLPIHGSVGKFKWGRMQYVTDAGMSLTPGTLTNSDGSGSTEWAEIPKTLDQRAAVINLSRNIVIQGIDDAAWQTAKFGAHVMVMGLTTEVKVDGVEFRRVGQAGAVGRYPFHWHMVSYNMPDGPALPSDGTYLGDVTGQYIKRSAIHQSGQRAVVIHGTCGATVDANVIYDITGHAIFLEESSEVRNVITNNTVIKVSPPTEANKLLLHDTTNIYGVGGSAGFWLANANNVIDNNWAFNCQVGFWNAFAAARCFNLSQEVPIVPETVTMLSHSNNIAGCNNVVGLITEAPQNSNAGAVRLAKLNLPETSGNRFLFTGNQVWKNLGAGYNNRVGAPGTYRGWTAADNGTIDFTGQADHNVSMDRALMVGVSLNNGNSADTRATNGRRAGFVSYDEGFIVKDIVAINYPYREPPTATRGGFGAQAPSIQGGGLMRHGEYITAINSMDLYTGWKTVNCHRAFMCTPPNIDGNEVTVHGEKMTLSILRDINGTVTGTPGKHLVWNVPFYTHAASNPVTWPDGRGITTDTVYTGLSNPTSSGISTDPPYLNKGPFYVDRYDGSWNIVGSWNVLDARGVGFGLSHFRHCGVARGGVYRVHFNGEYPSGSPAKTEMALSRLHSPSDTYTLGVAWANAKTVGTVYLCYTPQTLSQYLLDNSNGTPARPLAVKLNNIGMTSRDDVKNDTTGLKYWQDTTNNTVWVKVKGDQVYDQPGVMIPSSQNNPDRSMYLHITESILP